MLRNAIADHHRRRATDARRTPAAGEGLPEPAAVEPEAERTLCHCLAELAALLKPEYSELISRIDLGGGDPAAVGAELGITSGNLRVRLHRARAALRQELQRTCRTCAEHGCLDCTCGRPGGDSSCH